MSEPKANGARAARRRSRPERVALRRLALALVLLAGVIVVAGGAEADAPIKQGWWSKWEEARTTGTDNADRAPSPPEPVASSTSTTVPPPPTGDGGLTVALNADGEQAVAALLLEASPGSDGTLYLRAAQKESPELPGQPQTPTGSTVPTTVPSTTPPSTVNGQPTPPETQDDRTGFSLPPGATVMACRATSPWVFEMNGPYSHAPTWKKQDCAPGTVTGGNVVMFWTLPSSMQNAEGNYDIVLVPASSFSTDAPNQPVPGDQVTTPSTVTSPAQEPYTVNFDPPDSDTFVAEPGEEECEGEGCDLLFPDDEGDYDDESDIEELIEDAGPIDVPGPDGTDLALPADSDGSTLVATRQPRGRTRVPIDLADTRMERIMAATILLILAMALWWLGGSPARLPRMIGAVAGREVVASSIEPARRGIGRFMRERGGRPPRL